MSKIWSKISGIAEVTDKEVFVYVWYKGKKVGAIYTIPENARVLVKNGDLVKCGDYLISIDNEELRADDPIRSAWWSPMSKREQLLKSVIIQEDGFGKQKRNTSR